VDATALQQRINAITWCHPLTLGGIETRPQWHVRRRFQRRLKFLQIPQDLTGKTVLDIGAWDGYYSFAAEQRGAARVVACDSFAWALDRDAKNRYKADCRRRGVAPEGFDRVPSLWQFEELPGKRGFDLARTARQSRVEPLVADYLTMSLEGVGRVDVVLYLGVLYHMENPLAALRRVRELTRELVIIETEAIAIDGFERTPMSEFFPQNGKLAGDPTNFWAPNAACLVGLCETAGFGRVRLLTTPPRPRRGRVARYRLMAHVSV
jgi:tRNA (mo5U34)-methyltransferase